METPLEILYVPYTSCIHINKYVYLYVIFKVGKERFHCRMSFFFCCVFFFVCLQLNLHFTPHFNRIRYFYDLYTYVYMYKYIKLSYFIQLYYVLMLLQTFFFVSLSRTIQFFFSSIVYVCFISFFSSLFHIRKFNIDDENVQNNTQNRNRNIIQQKPTFQY